MNIRDVPFRRKSYQVQCYITTVLGKLSCGTDVIIHICIFSKQVCTYLHLYFFSIPTEIVFGASCVTSYYPIVCIGLVQFQQQQHPPVTR